MAKMTSMLLMLVMIGAFIAASQAITCYLCLGCDDPFSPSSSSQTCEGELCAKAKSKSGGWFTNNFYTNPVIFFV